MNKEPIMEMPDSDTCYIIHLFSPSIICPDFNEADHMKPTCQKYNELLTWTRSGRVLKCAGCLREDK